MSLKMKGTKACPKAAFDSLRVLSGDVLHQAWRLYLFIVICTIYSDILFELESCRQTVTCI